MTELNDREMIEDTAEMIETDPTEVETTVAPPITPEPQTDTEGINAEKITTMREIKTETKIETRETKMMLTETTEMEMEMKIENAEDVITEMEMEMETEMKTEDSEDTATIRDTKIAKEITAERRTKPKEIQIETKPPEQVKMTKAKASEANQAIPMKEAKTVTSTKVMPLNDRENKKKKRKKI